MKWKDPIEYHSDQACEDKWKEIQGKCNQNGHGEIDWEQYILQIIKLGYINHI